MGFKKVVVAIDGSKHSYHALKKAVEHVNEVSGELTVVHIVPDTGSAPIIIGDFSTAQYDYRRKLKEVKIEEAEQIINRAKQEVQENGGTSQYYILEGDPANSICQFSEKENFDLIIIGSRGLGSFKEMVLGSVSHKVAQTSSIPVMIIK
ncbi:universal stress protein [Alkalihalobacterium chitinilyticum]|uniref:Universal stress protein n=1 Tax=Alkalihalobacterium chitinilyticum TaxID=2980103 RepID=A0ABT5VMF8_9BACI|nr:universal stress protein [Alkalihalobacterium chitinilyticum]MDE5415678.1 universal stress protein [Alkalihalobacterium chitinilyticum]